MECGGTLAGEHAKVTEPANPLVGVTVMVKVAVSPASIVPEGGLAAMAPSVKSGGALLFTVTETAEEVLAANVVSPAYEAAIECVPTASVEVENVATPEPLSVPLPMVVEPSMKFTLPVGVPLPDCGVTVALNITD